MNHYIAFLRAINITGRFVAMESLHQHFRSLGLSDVATYIQSGNVSFSADERPITELQMLIAEYLEQMLGFPVETFIRSQAELDTIIAAQPFPEPDPAEKIHDYVVFLAHEPEPERQQALLSRSSRRDNLHIDGELVFWRWNATRGNTSLSNTKIEKILGMRATARQLSTIQKLAASLKK